MRKLLVVGLAMLSLAATMQAVHDPASDPHIERVAARAYRLVYEERNLLAEAALNDDEPRPVMRVFRENASTLTVETFDLGEEEDRLYGVITQQRLPDGAPVVIAEGIAHHPFDGSTFVRSGLAAGMYRFNASAIYGNSASDWSYPVDVKLP